MSAGRQISAVLFASTSSKGPAVSLVPVPVVVTERSRHPQHTCAYHPQWPSQPHAPRWGRVSAEELSYLLDVCYRLPCGRAGDHLDDLKKRASFLVTRNTLVKKFFLLIKNGLSPHEAH